MSNSQKWSQAWRDALRVSEESVLGDIVNYLTE